MKLFLLKKFVCGIPSIISLVFFYFFSVTINAQIPTPDHIVIVIDENHGYDQIINNSAAPYINSLASDSLSALFNNYHGVTHPSQPNYLYLFSGSNQGVTNDNTPTTLPFTSSNLGAELIKKGVTFKGYSEDLPSVGFNGTSSGQYKRKHNPWVNWQDADSNGIPSSLNVPLSSFPSNYDSLPKVSFVIPNQDNDMHDGTITAGDSWLQNKMDSYIQWAKTHNSLFIFTFDEDDFTPANRVVTIICGQSVRGGIYQETVNHINLLRTIEEMYGLGYAGSSKDSSAIISCWKTLTSIEHKKNNVSPNFYKLFQNYPNPFNPTTTIKYNLPKAAAVKIIIYDLLGREIKTLVNNFENAGNHEVIFIADKLPSGTYYYSFTADDFFQVRKAILMK